MIEIVTPGGASPDGMRIINVAQAIVNFFTSSPQRKQKFLQVIKAFDLPSIALKNYPDTLVTFACILLRSVMAIYYALSMVGMDNYKKIGK